MRAIVFAITLIAFPYSLLAAGKTSTNAAPPKLSDEYINRMNLATEIPNPIEQFKYKVIGTINGVVYYPSAVPLVDFDNTSETWKSKVGEVPVGSEITLDIVQGFQGRIFYGIDLKKKVGGKDIVKYGWLDGMFVQIAGKASK
jgi:hypothetical protein